MLLFCVVPASSDSTQHCYFTVCRPNLSLPLCSILPPSLLSPGVLQLKGHLPAVSQIQVWGEEMDVASYFSVNFIRAKRCSKAELLHYVKSVQSCGLLCACMGQDRMGRGFYKPRERCGKGGKLPLCQFTLQTLSPCNVTSGQVFPSLGQRDQISRSRKDCSACSARPLKLSSS